MKRLICLCSWVVAMLLITMTIAFAAEPTPAAVALPPVIEMYKGYIILGLTVAYGISEALALIPGVKANGIFHGIYLTLGKILGKEVK